MKKAKKEELKVISTQKYTFEIIHYDNGTWVMKRYNENFSVIEMLGILSLAQHDLITVLKAVTTKEGEIQRSSINSPVIHPPNIKPPE